MGPITEASLLRARNTNQGPPRHRPCDQILTRRRQIRECHSTRDDLVEHARPPLPLPLVPAVLAPRPWAVHRMAAEDSAPTPECWHTRGPSSQPAPNPDDGAH